MYPQAVLPALLTRLRKGAFLATSGTSYPCLLPLLASVPLQTLLAPADGRAGAPFCAALLENLWSTIAGGGGGGGDGDGAVGDRGGAPSWLVDVVSAHVECAAFLLLRLPPPPEEAGGGDGGMDSELQPAVSATENLARAVRRMALDEEGEGDAVAAGGGVQLAARESSAVMEAFGRALGQLHRGAEKGAGVMGSTDGRGEVWGALLRELTGALDQR